MFQLTLFFSVPFSPPPISLLPIPLIPRVLPFLSAMAPACDEGSGQGGGDEVVENVLTGSQVSDEGVGQVGGGKG